MDSQSTGMGSGGAPVGAPQGGFDSGSASFENGTSEIHEVYSNPSPVNEATMDETPEVDEGSKIMEIQGTAHDKLAGLSEMEEAEVDEKPEAKDEEETSEEDNKNKLSFEQRVISLQAEALKNLSKSVGGRGKDKEKEDLLKKLKELMEELEESDSSNKVTLMTAVLGVILILLNSMENGTKKLEKEVKRAQ